MPEKIITLLRGDKVDDTVDYRDALPTNVTGIVRKILGADGYMRQEPGLTQFGDAGDTVSFVILDGSNDYLCREADLDGISNGKTGTFAARIKHNGGDGGNQRYLVGSTSAPENRFLIYRDTNNKITLFAKNASGTTIFLNATTSTWTVSDGWLNLLISWDLANDTKAQIYVNDTDNAAAASTFTNDTIDYTLDNWCVGADANGLNKLNADVAFLWFDQTRKIDFSVEANRRKFFDSNGVPADLGDDGSSPTGDEPILYLAPPDFETNKGAGGGLTLTGSLGSGDQKFGNVGIDRGGIWNSNQESQFRLSGTNFISIDSDGVTTDLGDISGDDTGSFAYSFNTQAIVANQNYYLYDSSNGFRQVTDPDVGNPIDVVWVDGYYFFTDGDNLYHTDLANESSIDPLKFATSEFSPDPTLGLGLTQDNKVIAFNRYSTEFFVNQANENFAFSRLPSRNVLSGIVGTHAKTRINGVYYCLGGSKESEVILWALGPGSMSNLTSREASKRINAYLESELEDVIVEGRVVDNYEFVIIHLPDETLMLNITLAKAVGVEQAWSILKSDVDGDIAYRAVNGVYDPRRSDWVYGDKYKGQLTYLDESVATHAGELAECILYTPFIYLETMSIDYFRAQTIPGFTSTDDATVFLSLTYNGVVWSMEATMQYGKESAYNKDFEVYRLGYVDDFFAFKLRWASRSRMAFATTYIEFG